MAFLCAWMLLVAGQDAQADDYAAAFVSQTAPSFIAVQSTGTVAITMQNTGTSSWVQGDVFLATQEPQDNYYWCIQNNPYGSQSGNRVVLPRDIAPGEQVTFNFSVVPLGCRFSAPSPLQFRMLSQLHGTFGDETPDPGVAVSSAADFVSQQVPAIVPVEATVLVTETFKNTTPFTWQTTDGYTLVPTGQGATTWSVDPVPLPAAVEPGASVTFSFYIVVPETAGTYGFQWQISTAAGAAFGNTSPATNVQVVPAGPANYEGLWWASPAGSEAGWGINFAHQGDIIFATWFTYDLTGKAWWLSMIAGLDTSGAYSGSLLQSTGPPFNSVPFTPSQVRGTSVGTGKLTFSDLNNGSFTYTVNGSTQTKAITREAYDQLPTCTFGLEADLTQAYNYQNLWWAAPAGFESGWGVNLTHQGNTIFATWFTYDLDGTPLWLSVIAGKTAAGVYSGTLYRTTGPAFNAVPFDPAKISGTVVGDATFTFADGNNATFAYTVNGVSQTKPITRQVFVTPGTVCQ